jgi:hypothetical protein
MLSMQSSVKRMEHEMKQIEQQMKRYKNIAEEIAE